MMTQVVKKAVLSEDEQYRYLLERTWDESLPLLVWIMLNPSTADHTVDDPTILACMDFARRCGYGGIVVVNLFAYRSPHPKVMQAAEDPIGPENDSWLALVVENAQASKGAVVAAWGTGGSYRERDYQVAALVEARGLSLLCFGKTKDGHPKHPLARGLHRIPRETKPFPLRAP